MRPKYTPPAHLPSPIQARMVEKARQSWAYVTTDDRAFFLDSQTEAERMRSEHGGTVYAPELP